VSEDELGRLEAADRAVRAAIDVDDFAPEALEGDAVARSW
jgi:hypothetical protein